MFRVKDMQVQWHGYIKGPSPRSSSSSSSTTTTTFTVTTDGAVILFVNRVVVLNASAPNVLNASASFGSGELLVAAPVELSQGLNEIVLEYEKISSVPFIRLQVCCKSIQSATHSILTTCNAVGDGRRRT
jgi:hypothetical protein